ncbi:MAG TPA: Ig-like domain-containing protein [Gemmatimonadaceae bacterium]|nr:Ig-like domain-containing protein [Gemmatimonadaceae bacterium]
MGKWFAGFTLLSAVVVVACSGSVADTPHGCGGGPPGVIVQVAGIDLQVRDPFGVAQAIGTVATVRRSDGTEAFAVVDDTLNIHAAFNVTGTFTVTLSRTYYRDAAVANVSVTPDGCVVHTTTVPVTLELAPGAPALRAMTVVGGDFLDHPGAQATLLAHFDADPGVSRAVTWQVSDATLASVDANGIVTAQCTKSGGTVKVTATSVVDASITSFVNLGVAPTASCP